jgi:hypothetical protein
MTTLSLDEVRLRDVMIQIEIQCHDCVPKKATFNQRRRRLTVIGPIGEESKDAKKC